MKRTVGYPLRLILLLTSIFLLNSCGTGEDKAKIKEMLDKSVLLKMESEKLAVEISAVQQRIRDSGDSDQTGDKVMENLNTEEKRVQDEGAGLAKLAADLKLANESLLKEKQTFGQKYLKP